MQHSFRRSLVLPAYMQKSNHPTQDLSLFRLCAADIPRIGNPTGIPPIDVPTGNNDQPIGTSQRTNMKIDRSRVTRRLKLVPGKNGLPDRFIPTRHHMESISTPFRVNKNPQDLTSEERLLRRRSPRADPFMPLGSLGVTRTRRKQRRLQRVRNTYNVSRLSNGPALVMNRSPSVGGYGLRHISTGSVWVVGGSSAVVGRTPAAVPDGTGRLIGSGTNAPMHSAQFLERITTADMLQEHEARIACALDFDRTARLLDTCRSSPQQNSVPSPQSPHFDKFAPVEWTDNEWKRRHQTRLPKVSRRCETRIPSRPFRVLEAPHLRDDFYCSTLAYSPTSGLLAVGLGSRVYLWSEGSGVGYPPLSDQHFSNYVTSLSFSSERGRRSILAVGRRSGLLTLWSTFEAVPRFEITHPSSISCVAFKQNTCCRPSERFPTIDVDTEEIVVGDESGNIWYYSLEWSVDEVREALGWHGSLTLLAKISAHTQQICGIAWSPDEVYLATGGNDNACMIFELRDIFSVGTRDSGSPTASQANAISASLLSHRGVVIAGSERTTLVHPGQQKHCLAHAAAVKAIAFAPWQPYLLATGGGTNDRAIHFYHTPSGACLATINVHAQVTSLIWSKTRSEIVATFGFAQPEHPYRIAVFAWPNCEQIAAVPWGMGASGRRDTELIGDCGRALWAISYPGRPCESSREVVDSDVSLRDAESRSRHSPARQQASNYAQRSMNPTPVQPKEREGGLWCPRTMEEGCIIVASSDQTVKFHEVWCGPRRSLPAGAGILGGSDILGQAEGIETMRNEVIR